MAMAIPSLCFFMILVICCCTITFAESMNMKYKDPAQPLRLQIIDLMLRMTLKEKIGQMTQINREVATRDVIKNYFIGSIMSSAGTVPAKEASPKTWINMVNELKKDLCLHV
nr:glycoside hydrolase family 3 C-terminal domain-containing protein [Tanacetum cinerariifolium]